MSGVARVLLFMVSCVFTENIFLTRLMGCCALDESRRLGAAAGVGLFTALVMTLSSAGAWMVGRWVLTPLDAAYLQTPAFVAVIILLTVLCAALIGRIRPALREALEGSLTWAAANCAVLGTAVLNMEKACSLGEALLSGLFNGLGFLLAIVCMAGVRERLAFSKVPESLRGLPIALISASLMALAFMGFTGLA